jgi:hypothetical protein
MPYQITSNDNNKLVLERAGQGCGMAMFIGIGTLFFIIGICLNIFMDGYAFPNILFKLLFPAFGLGAIVTGIYIPKINRETTPESITFDNSKGAVIIQMTKDGNQTGYIRYDEIDNFDIFVERRSSSSSSSGRGSSNSYYYHVLLRKKDGGEWYLTESGSRSKAEKLLQQLTDAVHLSNPYTLRVSPVFTEKLQKDETSGKTVITWKNKVSILAPLFLLAFAVTFISIISTVFMGNGFGSFGFSIFPVFIIGFILLVFVFVIFSIAKKMYRDATCIFSVVIDKQNFEYLETSKSTGVVKKSRLVPLKNVHIIRYTFTPVKNYGDKGLEILTPAEHDQLQKYKEKPFEVIKDLFSGKEGPIKLDIRGLNPVECLQLETWLQDLIKKRGDVDVL